MTREPCDEPGTGRALGRAEPDEWSEFDDIDRLFRPLSLGAPEALELRDDAALVAGRPGHELVITKDAIVSGVHVLPDDPFELVARKLLRVNLSDLAAKGAEPFGYFVAVAWPTHTPVAAREAFAAGLAADQLAYGLKLFGGDTVSTPGPLTASATLLGWVAVGAMIKRSTARPGDLLLVSGSIGDGGLGLKAARGDRLGLSDAQSERLAQRYRLPEPRLALREALSAHASAAADVSDGLLADASHIGEASGAGVLVHLDRMPLSPAASAWLRLTPDRLGGLLELATCGDDYEIVCTATSPEVAALLSAANRSGVGLTIIGEITETRGLEVRYLGQPASTRRTGWRHF